MTSRRCFGRVLYTDISMETRGIISPYLFFDTRRGYRTRGKYHDVYHDEREKARAGCATSTRIAKSACRPSWPGGIPARTRHSREPASENADDNRPWTDPESQSPPCEHAPEKNSATTPHHEHASGSNFS